MFKIIKIGEVFDFIKYELKVLNEQITKEFDRRDKWEQHKEKYFFDILDENSKSFREIIKLRNRLIAKTNTIVKLKDHIAILEEKTKKLSLEIVSLVGYKNENEFLKNENANTKIENENLKKEIAEFKKMIENKKTKNRKEDLK